LLPAYLRVNLCSTKAVIVLLFNKPFSCFNIALVSVLFYFKWIKERGKEEGTCTEKR
jgi:hypothetical protein